MNLYTANVLNKLARVQVGVVLKIFQYYKFFEIKGNMPFNWWGFLLLFLSKVQEKSQYTLEIRDDYICRKAGANAM